MSELKVGDRIRVTGGRFHRGTTGQIVAHRPQRDKPWQVKIPLMRYRYWHKTEHLELLPGEQDPLEPGNDAVVQWALLLAEYCQARDTLLDYLLFTDRELDQIWYDAGGRTDKQRAAEAVLDSVRERLKEFE